MPDFSRVCWAAPVGGAIIGATGAVPIVLGDWLGAPPTVAAAAAFGVLALVTGALHEDGLADVVDGFGGGESREQKLAIMRDSRLGAFGVLALCLSILLRVSAVAAMTQRGSLLAVLAIIAASALSRAVGLIPMIRLPAARGDGVGWAAVPPLSSAMRLALCIGVAFGLAPALGAASVAQAVVGVMASFAAVISVTELARRQIGGYTGDVLGAAQQAAEMVLLSVLSAG